TVGSPAGARRSAVTAASGTNPMCIKWFCTPSGRSSETTTALWPTVNSLSTLTRRTPQGRRKGRTLEMRPFRSDLSIRPIRSELQTSTSSIPDLLGKRLPAFRAAGASGLPSVSDLPVGPLIATYRIVETFVSVLRLAGSDLYHRVCGTFPSHPAEEVLQVVHERRAVSPQPG